jgi:predicted Zn-dependent protease
MAKRRKPGNAAMVALFIGALATASGCATNPATGERELSLISESQEIELGKSAAAEAAATIGLYDDPRAAQYVAQLGKELAAKSERPGLPWKFQVADDPVVNAFALPGGFIFITRGILTHLNSEAQLASVMGHEIGHVTARHSVNQISKAQLAQLGLAVGMAVSSTVRSLGQLGLVGLNLLFLKYGRDAEREADDLGFRYTIAAGYDARAMPDVFTTLKRVSEASGAEALPSWLSTHPAPEERVVRIQKLIAEKNPPPGKVDHDEYLALLDGMVYGADPRQGFFEQGAFKHPGLKFQLAVPAGWKAQNLAQALVAQAPDGTAGFQLTIAPALTPQQALEGFTAQEGVMGATAVDLPVGGLAARSARFQAQTESGEVGGVVTFVAHGGKVFQLLGLAPVNQIAGAEPALRGIVGSFRPLVDPAALAVAPARIKIVAVPSAMTFAAFAASQPRSLPPDRLALLNQMTAETRLSAGQRVKVVVGSVRETEGNVAADTPTR